MRTTDPFDFHRFLAEPDDRDLARMAAEEHAGRAAWYLIEKRDYRAALLAADKALRADPDCHQARAVAAEANRLLDRHRTAANLYAQILETHPDDPYALSHLGLCLLRAGEREKTRPHLERFLAIRGLRGKRWKECREAAHEGLRLIDYCAAHGTAVQPAATAGPVSESPPPEVEREGAARRTGAAPAPPQAEIRVRYETAPCPPWFQQAPSGDLEARGLQLLGRRIALHRGFDRLLCLEGLVGVRQYHYQVEVARRVLRDLRGRAILADEVGLGKTIEAGMVVKEYLLRGLARTVLVLAPSSLVLQWRDEMSAKFGLEFATTSDPEFRLDPAAFWKAAPLAIASLELARRAEHRERVASRSWDIVVVDEAHRMKNRRTQSHRLVRSLQSRFLLLLTATPIQNDLLELHHLVTLVQPGLFGTEPAFRRAHVDRANPRRPRDRDGLRRVLRQAMIRNTRAVADVRLPPRHAATIEVEPAPPEAAAYLAADRFAARSLGSLPRMRLRHLLQAACSSPAALAEAAGRLLDGRPGGDADLQAAVEAGPLGTGAKGRRLLELLGERPDEKALVFSGLRATLEALSGLLHAEGIPHAVYSGSLTAGAKEEAMRRFREEVPVLLSSESGGEGRNLEFCRTLVNYDLPWNPLRIEQRVGRVHRIGQSREVFIFNLCTQGTLEEHLLEVLHDKLRMFELVVGEMDTVLGLMRRRRPFPDLVLEMWAAPGGPEDRRRRFHDLAEDLLRARDTYEGIKAFDEEVFADDLES